MCRAYLWLTRAISQIIMEQFPFLIARIRRHSWTYFLHNKRSYYFGGLTDYAEIDAKGIFLVDKDQGTDLIEIVESGTMKSVATINKDVANPQHVIKVGGNKAYVSCWGELNSDYSYRMGTSWRLICLQTP